MRNRIRAASPLRRRTHQSLTPRRGSSVTAARRTPWAPTVLLAPGRDARSEHSGASFLRMVMTSKAVQPARARPRPHRVGPTPPSNWSKKRRRVPRAGGWRRTGDADVSGNPLDWPGSCWLPGREKDPPRVTGRGQRAPRPAVRVPAPRALSARRVSGRRLALSLAALPAVSVRAEMPGAGPRAPCSRRKRPRASLNRMRCASSMRVRAGSARRGPSPCGAGTRPTEGRQAHVGLGEHGPRRGGPARCTTFSSSPHVARPGVARQPRQRLGATPARAGTARRAKAAQEVGQQAPDVLDASRSGGMWI